VRRSEKITRSAAPAREDLNMLLAELIAGAPVRGVEGDPQVEITGISYDSRETKPGHLFFSLARDAERNRANIDDALNRGARAVAVAGRWGGKGAARLAASVSSGTLIDAPQPRLLMGVAAARFFGAPSARANLVGITGTSGKTTTTYLLRAIFEAAGRPTGIIGTIGIFIRDHKIYHGLTTPESVDFESSLAQMEREGVHDAFAEVSSIGIAEGRVDALDFSACLFTNLGRDHLDYHGTLENYFAAKLRLFTEILPRSTHRERLAVVNGDDPFGRRILDATESSKIRKISFGLEVANDVHPISIKTGIDGIHGTISVLGRAIDIDSPLLGEFYLRNILGASALSAASGIDELAVAAGVRRCSGAPGRMEAVRARDGVTVLVDYAHKPDALEAVLSTLRPLTRERLICVFGCGGDRDRGKRPVMGEIAARRANLAILTSDNPRTEDPLQIIAEVEGGLKTAGLTRIAETRARDSTGYIVEPDRRGAIAIALRLARPGDVVVIAGKGHEDYQLVGNRVLKFDDRTVVRELASELGF
jgi:UDP-N-acetylmuramoyl-L-alanyl-D-glutamate--2,6-diaminopimelate ligase